MLFFVYVGVCAGETNLYSKINENELNIEGYSSKHCDHPNDPSRGGIGIYYKSFLPCIFKPELTKLNETFVIQVKVGTRKCFFIFYRNTSSENNSNDKVDEFANELNNSLNNIKGENPYTNFIIGDLNAKNTTILHYLLLIVVHYLYLNFSLIKESTKSLLGETK